MRTLFALSLASIGLAACTLPPQTNATNAAAAPPLFTGGHPGHLLRGQPGATGQTAGRLR